MELGFVFAVLRRYAALLMITTLVGLLLGVAFTSRSTNYRAVATLLIQSPSNGNGPIAGGDPDRYVDSEVRVLASSAISDAVTSAIGESTSQWTVAFTRQTASNVVDIVVTSESAEVASDVANAFATAYVAQAQESPSSPITAADLVALQARLTGLVDQLAALNANLRASLPAGSTNINDSDDTASLAQRDTTLLEYQRLLGTKTQVESELAVKINSRLLNPANIPEMSIQSSKVIPPIAGAVAGAIIGIALALMLGRFANDVIGVRHFEEIVGAPVACVLPGAGGRSSTGAVAEGIERVRVSIASVHAPGHLRVAVGSTLAGLDSNQLAGLIAESFAGMGDDVVLVAADWSAPDLAHRSPSGPHDQGSPHRTSPGVLATSITYPSSGVLPRGDVNRAFTEAAGPSGIAVFDVGPLLASTVALEAPDHVDVLVILAPERGQPEWQLRAIASLLAGRRATVVPVLTQWRMAPPQLEQTKGPPALPTSAMHDPAFNHSHADVD